MLITKKKVFNSRTQAQTKLYGIDFDKALVKLNELSSTLLHNSSTWTFMKEVVVGGLVWRHPAGRPAKAYMFCGTGLGRHFEDYIPQRDRPAVTRSITNPPQYETRRDG